MKRFMKNKNGFTLIELLIVVAILTLGFEGLFQASLLMLREGSAGAKEMSARQQLILASSVLFKDVKNAKETLKAYKNYKSDSNCLILKLNRLNRDSKSPDIVIYHKENDRLYRIIYFGKSENYNKTTIAENINEVRFEKKDAMIKWNIEAEVKFGRQDRKFKVNSAARINGGQVK